MSEPVFTNEVDLKHSPLFDGRLEPGSLQLIGRKLEDEFARSFELRADNEKPPAPSSDEAAVFDNGADDAIPAEIEAHVITDP
jgi:hypothetical protein